jgi:ABC-type molybdate transport system substrate-binding protein
MRLLAGPLFFAAAAVGGNAGATELRVLSIEVLQPALQELAPAFEASSKDKLKIDYASPADIEKKMTAEEEYDVVIVDRTITNQLSAKAKLAAGFIKLLAKKGPDQDYVASTTNWTQEPQAANALIEFLATPRAAEVYKAKGLQPG